MNTFLNINVIYIIFFLSSCLFSKEINNIKNQQKVLFNNHKQKVEILKKDYLLNKDNLKKEYDHLLPLFNSLNKEYNMMLDSIDNVIKNQINNYSNDDNPQMSKFFQLIEKTKTNQANKLKNRKKYYRDEYAVIDSTIDFLFDIILLYEKSELGNNNVILSLDAEILALQKIINNAEKTISNYEKGVSSKKLNYSITSLINADRYIYEENYDLAINECQNAINNFPDYPIAYEKLGSVYYLNNNLHEALKNWTIALSMDPQNLNLNKFLNEIKNTN